MIEKLEKIGLSRIEAKAYLALLELGPSFAGGIIKQTKQHRQQVYEALERLQARHLVLVSQNHGKKFFQPTDPQQLFAVVREQETVLQEIVPELQKKFESPEEEVIVYRDVEGYRRALYNRVEVTPSGCFILVVGGTGKEFYELTKNIFEKYVEALQAKEVGVKWVIYKSQQKEFRRYFGKYLDRSRRARVLGDVQAVPVATIILKDRLQISLFYPHPTIVEIVNKSLAEEYQRYFDMLWRQAKELVA